MTPNMHVPILARYNNIWTVPQIISIVKSGLFLQITYILYIWKLRQLLVIFDQLSGINFQSGLADLPKNGE